MRIGIPTEVKNHEYRVAATPEGVRELTIETIAERRASKEGEEGLAAFLEKRKPDWVG